MVQKKNKWCLNNMGSNNSTEKTSQLTHSTAKSSESTTSSSKVKSKRKALTKVPLIQQKNNTLFAIDPISSTSPQFTQKQLSQGGEIETFQDEESADYIIGERGHVFDCATSLFLSPSLIMNVNKLFLSSSDQITLILRHHDHNEDDEKVLSGEQIEKLQVHADEDRHRSAKQHTDDDDNDQQQQQQQQQFQRSTSTRKEGEGDVERESTIARQNNTDRAVDEVSCNSTATAERSQQQSSYEREKKKSIL